MLAKLFQIINFAFEKAILRIRAAGGVNTPYRFFI